MKNKKTKTCKGCKHIARFHYKSDFITTFGRIFCRRDNCYGWNRCDQEGWREEELLGSYK